MLLNRLNGENIVRTAKQSTNLDLFQCHQDLFGRTQVPFGSEESNMQARKVLPLEHRTHHDMPCP